MIVSFTDFGPSGHYTAQMEVQFAAAGLPFVNWMDDAPRQNPKAASYLLAAGASYFPEGCVFLAVIDPGVGSERPAVAIRSDGRWYVGPGNGLFEIVLRRSSTPPEIYELTWTPDKLSSSFHGRDLFSPVAVMLSQGQAVPGERREIGWGRYADWPDDLAEIVYIDAYGNGFSGLRSSFVDPKIDLAVESLYLKSARTFSDVPIGTAFWYTNSIGLVEIAVNQGSAAKTLGLSIGTPISLGR